MDVLGLERETPVMLQWNHVCAGAGAAAPVEPEPGGTMTLTTGPATLAIDIGASGLKASVLDATGAMVVERVRVETTYPCPPEALVAALTRAPHLCGPGGVGTGAAGTGAAG